MKQTNQALTLALILSLSLAACSQDDDKGTGKVKKAPAEKVTPETFETTAAVEYSPGHELEGVTVNSDQYTVTVNLASEDKLKTTEYKFTIEGKKLVASEIGGSESLKPLVGGQEAELARIQILDATAKTFILTVFANDQMVEGKSYLFVQDLENKMQLVKELALDQNNSDETIVDHIREFQERFEVSSSEAILDMAKANNGFLFYETTNANGDKHLVSPNDMRFNKGK